MSKNAFLDVPSKILGKVINFGFATVFRWRITTKNASARVGGGDSAPSLDRVKPPPGSFILSGSGLKRKCFSFTLTQPVSVAFLGTNNFRKPTCSPFPNRLEHIVLARQLFCNFWRIEQHFSILATLNNF